MTIMSRGCSCSHVSSVKSVSRCGTVADAAMYLCSLSGGVGQEEKTADEYDYLDESGDAGPTTSGPSTVDKACLACRRCCAPCCACSTRFQLALLSSLGFCISFGIRCNMGVAVLQMTSNVTQRYAVSPLLPGANVTIELVRPTFTSRRSCSMYVDSKGRNPHKRTSWKLVGNPGRELVAN